MMLVSLAVDYFLHYWGCWRINELEHCCVIEKLVVVVVAVLVAVLIAGVVTAVDFAVAVDFVGADLDDFVDAVAAHDWTDRFQR